MQIQQISVTGLFGFFNHVIPLNMNDHITIVHGPNGFGKTAMLRLLNGFFNSEYSAFESIPFSNFQITLDDSNRIEILKKSNKSERRDRKDDEITFDFYSTESQKKTFILKTGNNYDSDENLSIDNDRENNIFITSHGSGDVFIGGNIFPKSSRSSKTSKSSKFKLQNEPEWLKFLKQSVCVRLIESQRLLNIQYRSNSNEEATSTFSTVSAYSNEIAQIMRDKFTEYGVISQSLDRTFPNRLVQRQSSPNLTSEQILDRLRQIDATRFRLIEIGLLDRNESSVLADSFSLDESTKNVLSVYLEDIEKKLDIFNDVANKIDLLRKIINAKFAYSYKEMNFDKDKGFVFKTLYDSSVSDSDSLSPTDLSSGEQHELVLLYELLFKVEPKSLVLIDEPELSLHVGWQVKFLEDLEDIVKLADLDILMATHSPDIIQDRWDLTVELKGQDK
jgi:predicted ATP-binding protein involved in virulence